MSFRAAPEGRAVSMPFSSIVKASADQTQSGRLAHNPRLKVGSHLFRLPGGAILYSVSDPKSTARGSCAEANHTWRGSGLSREKCGRGAFRVGYAEAARNPAPRKPSMPAFTGIWHFISNTQ